MTPPYVRHRQGTYAVSAPISGAVIWTGNIKNGAEIPVRPLGGCQVAKSAKHLAVDK